MLRILPVEQPNPRRRGKRRRKRRRRLHLRLRHGNKNTKLSDEHVAEMYQIVLFNVIAFVL